MTSVAIGSIKASPGATTVALALATVWPSPRRVLLADLDPAGGDVALRFGLPAEPNVATLAAARGELWPQHVLEHCQRLPGGLDVLASSPRGRRVVQAALAQLDAARLVAALDKPAGVDVVADLGRLDPDSAALPAASAATVTLLVARPTATEISHAHRALSEISRVARRVAVLLVGERPYSAAEVAAALSVEVRALPVDRSAAAALSGDARWPRRLDRLPLLRALRQLAVDLIGDAHALPAAPARVVLPQVAEGQP